MQILSAAEAISPAIDKTKAVLFHPFRKGRSWKLAATAYLSSMGCVFLPLPLALLALPWVSTPESMSRTAFVLLFASVLAIYTALMWVFFYIGARLEFVLFDIVLFQSDFVAPAWRKYEPQTWRWIGLKVAFGTAISLVTGAPFAAWSIRTFSQLSIHPGQPPSPAFFGSFFLAMAVMMGWFGLMFLFCSLLGDFVLPSLALEDATLGDALGRFRALVEAEPAQVFFFCCFKVLLAIAALVALEVCVFLAQIIAAIPLGIVAFLGWLLLHPLGVAGHLLMLAGGVALYLIFGAFIFYFMLGLQGSMVLFFEAYGMYFLGGRYPLLGDLLEPPAPPLFDYPPPRFGPPIPAPGGLISPGA